MTPVPTTTGRPQPARRGQGAGSRAAAGRQAAGTGRARGAQPAGTRGKAAPAASGAGSHRQPARSAAARRAGRGEGQAGRGQGARKAGAARVRGRQPGGRHRAASSRQPAATGSAARQVRPAVTVAGGLIWAAVLITAVAVASVAAEVVLIPVAAVASASACRSLGATPAARPGRRRRSRPGAALTVVAVAGSVAVPLAALAGPVAGVAALVLLVLAALGTGLGSVSPGGRLTIVMVVAGPALAAMSVILARHQSPTHALALIAATLAFDAGACMMGNARTPSGGPVGVVFGLVSVAVVALFVAAVMNPPFSGARPWVVFAVVGCLAAAGVRWCERAVPAARVPALRRLDSLMLAAPAWVISLAVLPHR